MQTNNTIQGDKFNYSIDEYYLVNDESITREERGEFARRWNAYPKLIEALREIRAIVNTYAGMKIPQEVADHQNNKVSELLNQLNEK